MSGKDMLIQNNYLEGADIVSNLSREKDPILYPMEENSEFTEASLVNNYSSTTQRTSLKRKNDITGLQSFRYVNFYILILFHFSILT